MRTVICDDDEKLCRILQIFLEEYGESRGISVDVEVFSDGEILLQQLETGKQYDLLFLDIIMKQYSDKEFRYSDPAVKNVKIWLVDLDEVTCKEFGAPHKKY